MPFCTACGRENPDDARFCSQCGTKMVAAEPSGESTATINIGTGRDKTDTSDRALSPVDAAAVDALPPGHALLVVQRGPGAGSRFLLDADQVNAGRHPDSHIFLDDVTVSRRHVEITRAGRDYTVRDVGSLNGTYLNRERVDEAPLRDGDELQIGSFKLVFVHGGG